MPAHMQAFQAYNPGSNLSFFQKERNVHERKKLKIPAAASVFFF